MHLQQAANKELGTYTGDGGFLAACKLAALQEITQLLLGDHRLQAVQVHLQRKTANAIQLTALHVAERSNRSHWRLRRGTASRGNKCIEA